MSVIVAGDPPVPEDPKDTTGLDPKDGHLWIFRATCVGASSIHGVPDSHRFDANGGYDIAHVLRVQASSLPEAARKAGQAPFSAWQMEDE